MTRFASSRQENRLLRLVPILLAGAAISCGGDTKGGTPQKSEAAQKATSSSALADAEIAASCWCVPRVKTIRIEPASFDVTPGSKFELRARLYDASGIEISEFHAYTPHWTFTPEANVNVLHHEGHVVMVEVPVGLPASLSVIDVVAEADFSPSVQSQPAKGRVVRGAPANDHIVADIRANGKPLSVALAEDTGGSSWDVTPVAFSRFADLGDRRGAGGVMVFSADYAMAYVGFSWSQPPLVDVVAFKAVTDPNALANLVPTPPLKKEVRIWIDPSPGEDQWPATTAADIARIQFEDAKQTFLRNRVGVEFILKGVYLITSTTPLTADCFWQGNVTGETFDGGQQETFKPASNDKGIDIFVINIDGISTGSSCQETATPGYRVFLNSRLTVPRVLGHEIGHVLLTLDDATDHGNAANIGQSNLLIESCVLQNCQVAPHKSHLSLGQACEMNRSAVVADLRVGLPSIPRCPPITKDVR